MTTHCTNWMADCAYIWVDQPLPVSVSVKQGTGNPVPAGTAVTFTATPTNGGTTPTYQWMVNGVNAGTNSASYTYIPMNEDEVTCVLTSNAYCVSGNPASAGVTVQVDGIPITGAVTGILASNKSRCYDATQTLIVAGSGTTFTVKNGGSATMIAGQSIRYLPGTTVEPGGYMHGMIKDDNNQYCGQKAPAIPMTISGVEQAPVSLQNATFSIYPNPTSGNFTLEQKGEKLYATVRVEVYGMRGEKVLSGDLTNVKKSEFSITGFPSGLYFVKVAAGEHMETIKLIKTQ